jgi:hypothetical protein
VLRCAVLCIPQGIPQEWKVMLGQAGLSAQEIAEDADMLVSVFKVMQFEQYAHPHDDNR